MEERKIDVLDKGFVRLVTYNASDEGVCDAARVSYQKGTKKVRQDRDLIRYLLRHEHGTPFEMNFFQFHVKAPIFVFRQWHRHRVGISINEQSGRYSQLENECYLPELSRIQKQSKTNKQGSEEELDIEKQEYVQKLMKGEQISSFNDYEQFIGMDVSRELARINLPVSTYSQMYWACNLRSLFNFLRLRLHPHAQMEIRVYAEAIYELIKPIVPMACEAFEDYVLNAVTFSRQEMDLIISALYREGEQDLLNYINQELGHSNYGLGKRELEELKNKLNMSTENKDR